MCIGHTLAVELVVSIAGGQTRTDDPTVSQVSSDDNIWLALHCCNSLLSCILVPAAWAKIEEQRHTKNEGIGRTLSLKPGHPTLQLSARSEFSSRHAIGPLEAAKLQLLTG